MSHFAFLLIFAGILIVLWARGNTRCSKEFRARPGGEEYIPNR
jgi:hypothetical protein